IGSPMVFQTAPPQPASNARMIISPVLVGGADASQNGLGELIFPAKLRTVMSGMGDLRHFHHGQSGALTSRHRIHHFAPAVYAIPAGKILRIPGLSGHAIGDDPPVAYL